MRQLSALCFTPEGLVRDLNGDWNTLTDEQRDRVLAMCRVGLAQGTPFPPPVGNSYPFGRTEIRNLAGTAGVKITVSYLGAKAWGAAVASGSQTGTSTFWSLPSPFAIPPSSVTGWQYAKFTFTALGVKGNAYELSNLYIDPRMH